MYPLLLLSLVFFLVLGTTPSSARHVININSSTTLQFSSLVWNPTAHHFIAGSATDPSVYAIHDEGTVKCLLSEPSSNSSSVSVTALTVDQICLRLIVVFSNPSSVFAYDLKSYRRIYAVPLPELDGAPGRVVVNMESGDVFVSSIKRGVVLKVGPQENSKKIISEFKIFDDEGFGGIVSLSHGYILVLQTITGKIFKVDTINGSMKELLPRNSSMPLAPFGHAIALQTEKSIVVATNQSLLIIESDDNNWTRGFAIQNKMKIEEGEMVVAVAMQEGEHVYVLVNSQKGYMIEEAVWEGYIHEHAYVFWCLMLATSLVCAYILWVTWQFKDMKQISAEPVNWREICSWFQKGWGFVQTALDIVLSKARLK